VTGRHADFWLAHWAALPLGFRCVHASGGIYWNWRLPPVIVCGRLLEFSLAIWQGICWQSATRPPVAQAGLRRYYPGGAQDRTRAPPPHRRRIRAIRVLPRNFSETPHTTPSVKLLLQVSRSGEYAPMGADLGTGRIQWPAGQRRTRNGGALASAPGASSGRAEVGYAAPSPECRRRACTRLGHTADRPVPGVRHRPGHIAIDARAQGKDVAATGQAGEGAAAAAQPGRGLG
jgi:hypothetical protein